MTTVTIPKELVKNKELIAVPRHLYDEFIEWHKFMKSFKTYIPTVAEKKMIKRAREDYKKGNYLTIGELKHKLGIKN